jgi:hypothetical protein
MSKINTVYAFQNISVIPQRGGIKELYDLMCKLNMGLLTNDFNIVEIPVDFIKNNSEEKKTGLSKGLILPDKNIAEKLYSSYSKQKVKYILYTELQLKSVFRLS